MKTITDKNGVPAETRKLLDKMKTRKIKELTDQDENAWREKIITNR